jgi:hypothetical protein
MIVDISRNPKQEQFFNIAAEAVLGQNPYRNLNYGGAIRGGKTFISLACLTTFCNWFPNSRWHIFRADFPALQSSTIPSLEKILAGSPLWGWNRDKSNFFAYHKKTEARIFFKGENITRDPELNDLLGMETNGIFFEQIEELSAKLWQIGQSRVGSWYIPHMPTPITLATFNPTQTWIKEAIYIPYLKGELRAPYYFLPALPNENPFVTSEQWSVWRTLAERYQKQFIEGDWTDFADKNNLWAFAFDEKRHVVEGEIEINPSEAIYLSFDFNKNPICCSVVQWYESEIRVIETIKLSSSDIYELCNYIKAKYLGLMLIVTGDASGSNSSALVKGNLNYYTVIMAQLNLAAGQMYVPSVNPRIESNQVLVNSLLSHYSIKISKARAAGLIFDLKNVRVQPDGAIEKGDRNDPTKQADALDTFRYFCNTFLSGFINYKQ